MSKPRVARYEDRTDWQSASLASPAYGRIESARDATREDGGSTGRSSQRAVALLMQAARAGSLLDLMEAARDVDEARDHIQMSRDAIDAMDEYVHDARCAEDPLREAVIASKERLETRLADAELRVTEMICMS